MPVTTLPPPRRIEGVKPGAKTAPAVAGKKKRSFWRKLWIGIQIGFVVALILGCILGYFIYEKALVYYARAETYDLKKLDDLNVTSTFYDVNGEELGRIFVEDRIVLKPDEIPTAMRQAVMAAEDRRFYQHGAIDYWGILRAFREDLSKKSRGVQGGSTIEQQLAKHLIGDFSRTMDRKFLEAFVAIRLEQNLTKDQIMNYYLNRIYFGKGYFGVGAAARGYFGKEASDMTVPECALLAGIIRAPTSSSRASIRRKRNGAGTPPSSRCWRRAISPEPITSNTSARRSAFSPPSRRACRSYVMAAAVKEMEQILSIEGTEEMPQGLTVRTNIDIAPAAGHRDGDEHGFDRIWKRRRPGQLPRRLRVPLFRAPRWWPMSPRAGSGPGSAAAISRRASLTTFPWRAGRMARCSSRSFMPWPSTASICIPASMINASYIDPSVPASRCRPGTGQSDGRSEQVVSLRAGCPGPGQ